MPLLARIRDAVKAAWAVLWGRTEVQLRMARIEREWMSVELEISAMFENVNALIARLAKRQKREKPSVDAVELPAAPLGQLGKSDIRRRIRERQSGTSRAATPPDHQEQSA